MCNNCIGSLLDTVTYEAIIARYSIGRLHRFQVCCKLNSTSRESSAAVVNEVLSFETQQE